MDSRPILHRRRLILGVSCFALTVPGIAFWLPQEATQAAQTITMPTFKSEHNEVQVIVVVRNSKGEPVGDLKREDFTIRDNGKLQKISSFAIQDFSLQKTVSKPETQPLTSAGEPASQALQRRFIALFFDDLHTPPGDFGQVQKAADGFVEQSLQPGDRVAIFKTSGNRDVIFTNDKAKLLKAISDMRSQHVEGESKTAQCPRISDYEAYLIVNQLDPEALEMVSTRLRNCLCPPPASDCPFGPDDLKRQTQSIAEATWQPQNNSIRDLLSDLDLSVRALGTMPGQKMLLLSSSGFLSGDLDRDIERVIDDALRSGVVMSMLSARGLSAEAPGGNLSEQRTEGTAPVGPEVSMYEVRQSSATLDAENAAMIDFSESTGGKFFRNDNDLRHGFNELAMPEVSYALTFSPAQLKYDGKLHKLKIEINRAGQVSVLARRGYFAPTKKESALAPPGIPAPFSPAPESKQALTVSGKSMPPATPQSNPNEEVKPEVRAPEAPEAKVLANTAKPDDAVTDASSPSVPVAKPTPALSTAMGEEAAFLKRAAVEVQHYIEAFGDLTANETRVMQSYDAAGSPGRERSMQSALVVYRLRTDPKSVVEYRDVISVDGHEIKDHADRAAKLWREVSTAHSSQEELRHIANFSERYDLGLEETGFTLFEGLPLRTRCSRDFAFHEVRVQQSDGHSTRIFDYRQVRPCDAATYHFALPDRFTDWSLTQDGELTLDADSAQIVREERNISVTHTGKTGPRIAHVLLDYGQSAFGILVPKKITIETYYPQENAIMTAAVFALRARMLQSYGPFSRFEVNTQEKTAASSR